MTDFAKQISAYQQLSGIYESLENVAAVLEDSSQKNTRAQLAIANQFVHTVGASTTKMIQIYSDIMSRENSTATTQEIAAIENELRNILVHATQDALNASKQMENGHG